MSSPNVSKAASIAPPTEMYVRATSATTEEFELPATLNKRWLTVAVEGVDLWCRFTVATAGSASGESLLETSVSTITSQVIGSDADGAYIIPAGQERQFDMSALTVGSLEAIKFLHKSSAATGYVRITVSSGK